MTLPQYLPVCTVLFLLELARGSIEHTRLSPTLVASLHLLSLTDKGEEQLVL